MLSKLSSKLPSLEKQIGLGLVFGIVVFAGVSLYGDIQKTSSKMLAFPWWLLAIVLFLTVINIYIRAFRWYLLLHYVKVKSSWWQTFRIYLAGLALTVTPGRVGELMKSYFLKQQVKADAAVTVPTVIFERFTDGIAMLILMSGGLILTQYGIPALSTALIIILTVIVLLHQRRILEYCLDQAEKISFISQHVKHLHTLYQSSLQLVQWRPMLSGICLGMLAWLSESLGFYLVLLGLGVEPGWSVFVITVFIFGFSGMIGFATFLPGGLGVNEASKVGLLILMLGMESSSAAAASILIRFCSLWFGVFWGFWELWKLGKR